MVWVVYDGKVYGCIEVVSTDAFKIFPKRTRLYRIHHDKLLARLVYTKKGRLYLPFPHFPLLSSCLTFLRLRYRNCGQDVKLLQFIWAE